MRRFELLALLLVAPVLPAQRISYETGPQVRTFISDVDGSAQPYALYVPPDFDPGKKYPLVLSLHGAYSNHRLNLKRVFGKGSRLPLTDSSAGGFPKFPNVPYLVASPLARGTMGYQGIPEKDVYDVLEEVKRQFPVDEDRIYLTGESIGGGGALWLGLTRPDIWAAVAAVCPANPEGVEELAPNALNLPIHLFHGAADPAVPVETSRAWQKRLLENGAKVEYVEYPNVRHNAWDLAYKDASIFDWFGQHRRQRYPDHVRFVTRRHKYNSAYWIRVDALQGADLASVDASIPENNSVRIDTKHVYGLTLRLAGHPRISANRPLRITVDGTSLRVPARGDISLVHTAKGWRVARLPEDRNTKRPGSEGPIGEALNARHIYVYGTADSPDEEVLAARRAVAKDAAEWSTPSFKASVSFRVLADKDVTEEDLRTSNLILFGTRETNSLIARFASRFPMSLHAGAADYGLVFVAPVDGRLVVVNSGRPWWTGADNRRPVALRYFQIPNRPAFVAATFPDYVVFKGSLDNIVAEGYFERDWTLPKEQAEKLKATGAIQVR